MLALWVQPMTQTDFADPIRTQPPKKRRPSLSFLLPFGLGTLFGGLITWTAMSTSPKVPQASAARIEAPSIEKKVAPERVQTSTKSAEVVESIEWVGAPMPTPNKVVEDVVKPNRFIADIMEEAGLDRVTIDKIVRSLTGTYDFRKSRPGHKYRIELDPEGKLVSFRYKAAPDEIYWVKPKDDGFVGHREEVELKREVVTVEGKVKHSLYEAFLESGESPNLAMSLAEVFQFDIDFFTETQKNDRFRFLVEKFTNEGETVRYGRIYAAEYAGDSVGTKRLFWFQKGRTKGYYDEEGKAAQRAFLRSPLKYSRVSSRFGYRVHPILRRRHFHGGVDYAAPRGTPVQSVADGKVIFAGPQGPAGNLVKIKHSGGYQSLYLHLSRILVRAGQRVSQSTVIGKVGSTGRSTGPHLDFRLKQNGRLINPMRRVAPRTKSIPKRLMAAFQAQVAPWAQRMSATEAVAAAH